MKPWPFRQLPPSKLPDPDDPNWERALINSMAVEFLRDQRRGRRWGLFFKLAALAYVLVLLAVVYSENLSESVGAGKEHTALVEIDGVISADSDASADKIITALRKAFKAEHAKGVILRINSPGGSPVQSGYVNDEIRRLKAKYPDKPVYAVAVDACASGAYYIAVAADEIYVDKASLVGSIGVRIGSFGFSRAMEELGIERRLLVAGDHKGILDPFSPLDTFDEVFVQRMLDGLHQQFIDAVKEGRGDRLAENDELFTGLFWTGAESVELGLADGLGSSSSVARDLIGAEEIVAYSRKRDLLEKLTEQLGASIASTWAQLIGAEGTVSLR
ncbi:S49 family peptidase [Thiorhodovibrio frisius]|uniref:ClpP class periplasmic serine protease n=1 Tax=Thiorhodovibrio frisius TaxID=631362 RepID=H8YXE1_9GAMM|nr:S49 family peptidase [Thiorhodovibrio frisius]EIC23117.1 ClpP class periplasmic serine protease [Thiorhodovibrio frisius]WPL22619.1 Putative signal peptide peptidase SppA [Thiorhodovibrio frisius]